MPPSIGNGFGLQAALPPRGNAGDAAQGDEHRVLDPAADGVALYCAGAVNLHWGEVLSSLTARCWRYSCG